LTNEILQTVKPLVCEAKLLHACEIPFSDQVITACAQNYCGRYGKRWGCPPAVGNPRALREKLLKYEYALVFSTRHELEDSFDLEGMNAGREAHCRTEAEVLRSCAFEAYIALGASSCDLCKECTYPNAPCRFPDRMKMTVESHGIDVVALCASAGLSYSGGERTVTYFSVVFFRQNKKDA
jgi:predicted metal-binding protein